METRIGRERTVTWDDPAAFSGPIGSLDGLDLLRAIGRGDLPEAPLMRLLGIEPVEVEAGRAVFAVEPAEYHYSPLGTVHGGLAATLCDTALGCAIHTLLPAGSIYTTLELKVNFVRPMTERTGRVLGEGKAIHVGSRVATAEARVTDEQGRLYAHATTTCLILDAGAVSRPGKGGALASR